MAPELPVDPSELNLTAGFAGTIVERIVLHCNRNAARTGADMENQARQRQEKARQGIRNGKKYTAGLHFASGECAIGDDVHSYQLNKKRQQETELYQAEQTKRLKYDNDSAVVRGIRASKPPDQWLATEVSTVVKWLKTKDDKWANPKNKAEWVQRYNQLVLDRRQDPSPPVTRATQPTILPMVPPPLPPSNDEP